MLLASLSSLHVFQLAGFGLWDPSYKDCLVEYLSNNWSKLYSKAETSGVYLQLPYVVGRNLQRFLFPCVRRYVTSAPPPSPQNTPGSRKHCKKIALFKKTAQIETERPWRRIFPSAVHPIIRTGLTGKEISKNIISHIHFLYHTTIRQLKSPSRLFCLLQR